MHGPQGIDDGFSLTEALQRYHTVISSNLHAKGGQGAFGLMQTVGHRVLMRVVQGMSKGVFFPPATRGRSLSRLWSRALCTDEVYSVCLDGSFAEGWAV